MTSPLVRASLAAGLLVIPVALEIAITDFGDQTWGELVFAGSQVLGWLIVLTVCRDLGRGRRPTRPARTGRSVLLAGVLAQVAFALTYGGLVAGGVDPGGAFLLFALGFLLVTFGGVMWGISMLRHGHPEAGWGLVAVALLGILAITVPVDPFHDIFLLTSYLAWVPVGRAAGSAHTHEARELSGSLR